MNKILLIFACLLLCDEQAIKAQPRNANAHEKQQAATSSPSPIISQTPVNNPAEDAGEAYRKERDAKDDVFRDEQVRQGRIVTAATERIFYATAIYVFVTAVYAFFAFLTLREIKKQATGAGEQLKAIKKQSRTMLGTWQVMRRQAEAMEKQLEAIAKQESHLLAQVDAAKEAADMAKGQLVAMQSQERAQYQSLEATKGQLDAMKAQAKTMDRSLVLGTRAYVGVHSIRLEHETERILFEIENIGRVPAKDIQVVYEQIMRIPEHIMPETPDGTHYGWHCKEITRYGVKRNVWQLRIPWLHTYGPTKLFPGSLRIKVVVPLGENLYVTPDQYRVIISGEAEIIIRGCITYSDGFHKGKRTEFAFSYQNGGVWIPLAETGMDHYQTDPEKPDSDYNPN